MKKKNAILTGILITLALLIYGEIFGKSNTTLVPSVYYYEGLNLTDKANLLHHN